MTTIRNWFRRRSLEQGLDRELQYHFDRRVADLTAGGVAEAEARRKAAMELGATQVREEVRDVWFSRWFRDLLYDLRFSARSYLRTPGFTATALLSLALGIGATTAIYSLVDQVILHALPVRDPARLVLVDWNGEHATGGFGSWNLMSYPICHDLQRQTQHFEGVLCRAATEVNLVAGGDPVPVPAEIVSGSYFPVLGVGPARGRVLTTEDDGAPGSNPVVVLSHSFWQARFNGDPDVVGRKVLINNHPMTVAGVAAAGFVGVDVGSVPALWLPVSMYAEALPGVEDLLNSPMRWMQVLARLRPEVSREQAQAGLMAWFRPWLEENAKRPGFPVLSAETRSRYLASSLQLLPAPQGHSPRRRELSQPLWLLFAATVVLLGLACLNVAGLSLARGSARARELGTRLALGASRGRISRQLLTDMLLLSCTGGALGIALAPVAMRALLLFLPDSAGSALRPDFNLRMLAFALVASLAAGLASGLAPALNAGRDSLIQSLRERGGAVFGGVRLRKSIVTLQVAFSLILVVSAVLFLRSLTGLLNKGPGFETTNLLSFTLEPKKNGYSTEASSQLIDRIHDAVRALPITRDSGIARNELLSGGSWRNGITILSDRRFATERGVDLNAVSPGFFATLQIPFLAGRDFDRRDILASAAPAGPRVAIVTESFVKRYLGGRDPAGVLIGIGGGPDVKPDIAIVGVVADFNNRGLREEREQAFFPISSRHQDYGAAFYVKFRGPASQAFEAIRQVVRNADPQLPILEFRTAGDQVSRSLNTERLLAALSGSFGGLALLLSLIGLYGVMSFVVTRRTREIGIRHALGASSASSIGLVLRDAAMMIGAGIAIALPCVAALGRYVQAQLFGVTATDPTTVAAASAILAAGSLAAAFVPAWRASKVSPTDALRLE